MNWRRAHFLAPLVSIILLIAIGAYFVFSQRQPASQRPKATIPPSATAPGSPSPGSETLLSQQVTPVPTLPPPLAKAEFPSQQVTYPPSWPRDLQLPEQLVLVDTSSGSLPASSYKGWAAKFRYQGPPGQAADLLSSFLTSKGWQVHREDLDSGGVLLDIDRDARASVGSFILDSEPGNPSVTRVLMTVRL